MNNQIKILVHGMTGNPGGMESCIMNYVRNISPEKIHFDFLCVNNKPAYYQEIINRGSKIYVVHGRRKIITQYRQLVSIFKENKYDVFWSNRCSLSGGMVFFKIARKYGVLLCIIHAHTSHNMGSFLHAISHKIDRYCIKKYATDFWACSQASGKYFYRKEIIDSLTYKLINNAINVDKFTFNSVVRYNIRKELKVKDKFVIGHVGTFNFSKNHRFLIRVFYELYKKEPNVLLFLIGDGELRPEIEAIVKSLNLDEAVSFLGTRSDIPELLNAMDIFLLPSRFEGLPVSLIETQAMSLYSFTSTNVSSDVAITDALSFIDLKQSPEEWADIILAQKNYARINMTEEIRKAGYDIKTEAANLEQYLLDRIESVSGIE